MTHQTFLDYKREGDQRKCYDREEGWEEITVDVNRDYLHIVNKSADGDGEYLINLHSGAASLLREEDGKIMNTPASDDMLRRVEILAASRSDEELILAWRLIESLFLKLYLISSGAKVVFLR